MFRTLVPYGEFDCENSGLVLLFQLFVSTVDNSCVKLGKGLGTWLVVKWGL